MKVVLSPNPYRDRLLRSALMAERILKESGVETALCLPFALDRSQRVELPRNVKFLDMQTELSSADLLLCFGGDGTILHAAKDANAHGVPIMGVNMGSVGYMAELEHGELHLLSKLAEGKYTLEKRMMLDVRLLREGKTVYEDLALNDAVVTKGAVARILDLTVYGDKMLLSDFAGDGLILSTPTGSTAYSLSAGGPIVEPTAENIIVTPICAHALHARPVVLSQNRVVTVKMGKLGRKTAYLTVDGGKAIRLTGGDTVEIRKSKAVTRLARLSNRSFYEIMNQKLGNG